MPDFRLRVFQAVGHHLSWAWAVISAASLWFILHTVA